MTAGERKALRYMAERADLTGIESVIERAEAKAVLRKSRTLRKKFQAFMDRHSGKHREPVRMDDYWAACDPRNH